MDAADLWSIYRRQAEWFAGERSRLLRKANIAAKRCVLDLGCGTGAILPELRRRAQGTVYGLDSDSAALSEAGAPDDPLLVEGDAGDLPFKDGLFDLVFTQMFFLWVHDIPRVLGEVHRVLRCGGHLILAAEPDYGGAIEHPETCDGPVNLARRLEGEGADPAVARKLGGMLEAAGFEVQCGIHPARPLEAADPASAYAAPELLASSADRQFLFIPYFYFFCVRA